MKKPITLLLAFLFTINSLKLKQTPTYRLETTNENASLVKFTVNLKPNIHIALKIAGNPTTGFEWSIRNPSQINKSLVNPTNLNQNNSCKFTTTSDDGITGGSGFYRFEFDIRNKGTQSVEFIYRRPWETESPAKTYIVKMQIR
jgi:predicted secreted protein